MANTEYNFKPNVLSTKTAENHLSDFTEGDIFFLKDKGIPIPKDRVNGADSADKGKLPIVNADGGFDLSKIGSITEISTQTVRIWGFETGVYRLTYNGSKTIYYNGSTSTTSFTLSDTDPLLFVQKDSSTVTSWWVFDKYTDSTYTSALQVRFGSTTSSSGTSKVFMLPESAGTSGYLLKSNGSSSAPTWVSSGNALPVGTVQMQIQGYAAPADIFGGTWTELTELQGRFPLGANSTYTLGSTGGEATHTLTVNEIPSHSHNFAVDKQYGQSVGEKDRPVITWGTAYSGETLITSTGGGAAHNNMPPFVAVKWWRKTAM